MKALILAALLLLAPAAWAQNESGSALTQDEQQLITKVLSYHQTKSDRQAAEAILAQPEMAEHTFRILLTTVGGLEGSDKRLVLIYMNIVARVMDNHGHGADMASLRAFHLLVEPNASPSPSP